MSDVSNAPAPAAPSPASTPAPRSEVVVDQNPVNAPAPLRNEAPPAPEGDKRPGSRREAIQKAFERAQEKGRPGPAHAKPGHNQPPEEAKLDLKKPPKPEKGKEGDKIDLKQPPKEQHREGGKFARAPQVDGQAPQVDGQAKPVDGQPDQVDAKRPQLPEHAPYRDPPPRMADHAKAEWHAAPESVRGEVHRMAQEFDGAYRHYRADHEEMNSIRQYHEMAQQHGTTLQKALSNYVGMEQKLRTDLVGGLDTIIGNLNLRTADGQKITTRDVAWHILNQSPEQHQLVQQSNQQTAASHQIGALSQEITGLKQALMQMHSQQQFVQTRSTVDQFAEQHPRFDELGDLIEQELRYGFELPEAYRRAELLRPASPYGTAPAAQTRSPPAQTRPDKSIAGAPDSPPSNGQARSGKPVGRRDAIQRAIQRVNGGL